MSFDQFAQPFDPDIQCGQLMAHQPENAISDLRHFQLVFSPMCEALYAARPDLEVASIKVKIGRGAHPPDMAEALRDAEIVLDLTASVGAGRTISDEPERGRAASAFFNPAGNSVVTMIEDAARQTDLATLEAVYYGELVKEPTLHNHLAPPDKMAIGAGQCRATTNRMPSSTLLSSILCDGWAAK